MKKRSQHGCRGRQEQREDPAAPACCDCTLEQSGLRGIVYEIAQQETCDRESKRQPDENGSPIGDDADGDEDA